MKYFLFFLLGFLVLLLITGLVILIFVLQKRRKEKERNKKEQVKKNEKNNSIKNEIDILINQIKIYFKHEHLKNEEEKQKEVELKEIIKKHKDKNEEETKFLSRIEKANIINHSYEVIELKLNSYFTDRVQILEELKEKYNYIFENNKFFLGYYNKMTQDLHKANTFVKNNEDKIKYIHAKIDKLIKKISNNNVFISQNYYLNYKKEENIKKLIENKKNIIHLFKILNYVVKFTNEIDNNLTNIFESLKNFYFENKEEFQLERVFSFEEYKKQVEILFNNVKKAHKEIDIEKVNINLKFIYKLTLENKEKIEKEKRSKQIVTENILIIKNRIARKKNELLLFIENKENTAFIQAKEELDNINLLLEDILLNKETYLEQIEKIKSIFEKFIIIDFKLIALKNIYFFELKEKNLLNNFSLQKEIITDFLVNKHKENINENFKKEILNLFLLIENEEKNDQKIIYIKKLNDLLTNNIEIFTDFLYKEILNFLYKNMNVFRSSKNKLDASFKIAEEMHRQGNYPQALENIVKFLEKEII
ncbi:hypothetical protein [Mycoplasma sp. CB776]